jgi:hypothetical protein
LQPEDKEQEDTARETRMEANVAAADATQEDEEKANEGEETEDPENEQEYKVDISKYSMIFKVHQTRSQDNKERTGRCQNVRQGVQCTTLVWIGASFAK